MPLKCHSHLLFLPLIVSFPLRLTPRRPRTKQRSVSSCKTPIIYSSQRVFSHKLYVSLHTQADNTCGEAFGFEKFIISLTSVLGDTSSVLASSAIYHNCEEGQWVQIVVGFIWNNTLRHRLFLVSGTALICSCVHVWHGSWALHNAVSICYIKVHTVIHMYWYDEAAWTSLWWTHLHMQ